MEYIVELSAGILLHLLYKLPDRVCNYDVSKFFFRYFIGCSISDAKTIEAATYYIDIFNRFLTSVQAANIRFLTCALLCYTDKNYQEYKKYRRQLRQYHHSKHFFILILIHFDCIYTILTVDILLHNPLHQELSMRIPDRHPNNKFHFRPEFPKGKSPDLLPSVYR